MDAAVTTASKKVETIHDHINELLKDVNVMFANERRKVNERYREHDGVYLGRYAQWFVGFFFCLGFFGFYAVIAVLIAKHYGT